jgi:flagellar hook-length control protein FliK
MDVIGSVNSFKDDTVKSTRVGKSVTARRDDDETRIDAAFDALLAAKAALSAVPAITAKVQVTTEPSTSETMGAAHIDSAAYSTAALAEPDDSRLSGVGQAKEGEAAKVEGLTSQTSATSQPQDSNGSTTATPASITEGLLAQLAALETADDAPLSSPTTKTATNAANLAAGRSNAGVIASIDSGVLQTPTPQTANVANSTSAAPANVGANDNSGLIALTTKSKATVTEIAPKVGTEATAPVSSTVDGPGSTSVVSGQEGAAPANDQVSRTPQLTPHTIPMLAATMMRRLESGSRQFMMRLDPPELGQVEVKLTVAADKKVRAVVSADRPEALADLVRSARELTRALQDAGLDLDENGLTFQLNDPSSGDHKQNDQRDRNEHIAQTSETALVRLTLDAPVTTQQAHTSNDPFQRWQRARIALTA